MNDPSAETPPDDWWHTNVFVHIGWLECEWCHTEPDTEWAWQDLTPGQDPAIIATNRIVPRLIAEGWKCDVLGLLCPNCAHMEIDPRELSPEL